MGLNPLPGFLRRRRKGIKTIIMSAKIPNALTLKDYWGNKVRQVNMKRKELTLTRQAPRPIVLQGAWGGTLKCLNKHYNFRKGNQSTNTTKGGRFLSCTKRLD